MARLDRPAPRIILTREDADAFGQELLNYPLVSYDTEWYEYDDDRTPVNNGLVFCAQFAYRDENGQIQLVFLYNYGESQGNIHSIQEWLNSKEHIKLAHNAPVDYHVTCNHGITCEGFIYDGMVMDHLLDERREDKHGLKECVLDFLGVDRQDFKHTFGDPKLRADGQPYASGEMIVPTLPEYVQDCPTWDSDWINIEAQASVDLGYWKWHNLITYACDDAWDELVLYEQIYKPRLEKEEWIRERNMWGYFLEVDSPLTGIICKLERKGMYVDLEEMAEMESICQADLVEAEAKALEWAGCPMNIGSDKQLGLLLHGFGTNPIKKTKTAKKVEFYIEGRGWPVLDRTPGGAPATGADALKRLRRELEKGVKTERGIIKVPAEELAGLDSILKYNKLETQHNTYLLGIPNKTRNNRIHGRLNQVGATSSRWSSVRPNLQNITTGDKDVYHIRDCFSCPPGTLLLVADWANLEYRLLAHFSQDPTLMRLFLEGWDMHSLTAYNIYPKIKAEVDERFGGFGKEAGKWIAEEYPDDRKRAKTLNFEIIYGVGHRKLAEQLRISEDEAKRMINGWFKGYPYVRIFMDRLLAEYREFGHSRLLDGRPRHADPYRLNHPEYRIRGEEERTLINAKIQGSAAAMAKRAMIRIAADEELRDLNYEMVMQVHDEILGESPIEHCDRAIEIIRPIMEQPFRKPLRLPMPVSIGRGPTWASAKAA